MRLKEYFNKLISNPIRRLAIFSFLGGLIGYSYYYFVGCRTGTCPITSTWYISTLYGAVAGILIGWQGKSDKVKKNEN